MSVVARPVPGVVPAARRRPRTGPGLSRCAAREALRDRGLLAQAVLAPLVVVLLAVLAGQLLVLDRPRTVALSGDGAAVAVLGDAFGAGGDAVSTAGGPPGGSSGGPGAGVDASVAVAAGGQRVTVRLAQAAVFAAGDLRREITAALPHAQVQVLGPDGAVVHDSAGQLLPAAVVLTALVLALPGTAGRVVDWRRRGVVDVLLPAAAARHGRRGAGLRLALLLVPSRWLLTLPAVVVAVGGCALTGVLALDLASALAFAALVLVGSATCTTLGTLVGCLLRSRREARAVLWPAVGVVALVGLVLLPAPVLPAAAAAVLRWTPPAVFAEGVRTALTGAPGTSPALSLGLLAVVLAAATVALAGLIGTALRPGRRPGARGRAGYRAGCEERTPSW